MNGSTESQSKLTAEIFEQAIYIKFERRKYKENKIVVRIKLKLQTNFIYKSAFESLYGKNKFFLKHYNICTTSNIVINCEGEA